MSLGLDFHHFGLATRDAEQTIDSLRLLGYEPKEPLFDPLQGVNLVWCEHAAMPAIEVVYPSDHADGPLQPYLRDHTEMIYHLCYEVAGIEATADRMRTAGMRLVPVVEPRPAVLFGGRRVAFYMVRGLGLIELLEDR